MDLGLYELKYNLRTKLRIFLPYLKDTDPNTLSWSMLPIALLTAQLYLKAPENPTLYLYGLLLIFARMIVGTLDGMLAEEFNKQTPMGGIINRLVPEFSDLLLLGALAWAHSDRIELVVPALIIAHATSFLGLVGLVGDKPLQSVGPVGQTDRLVALAVISPIAALLPSAITVFFYWIIFGGLITCGIRLSRLLKIA